MKRYSLACLTLLAVLVPAAPSTAYHVEIVASADNTIYDGAGVPVSNGAGHFIFAGADGVGEVKRGLIRFPVEDLELPAGVTFDGVVVGLYMSRTPAGPETVVLRRLESDWGEGTSEGFDGEGIGGDATPGDATWQHAFFDNQNWGTPGGDFVAGDPSASAVVDDVGHYTWGPTPALNADVEGWLTAPETNFGWIVIGNEGQSATAKRFVSRDRLFNPERRPWLRLEYTPPQATPCTTGVFADSFESGDGAAWPRERDPGGDLAYLPVASMDDLIGMEVSVQRPGGAKPPQAFVLDNTPAGLDEYCFSFMFDPNSISIPHNTKINVFGARGPARKRILEMGLGFKTGEGYSLGLRTEIDGGTVAGSGLHPIADNPVLIEGHWKRSSGADDGFVKLYINGAFVGESSGLDNDERPLFEIGIGYIGLAKPGTDGTIRFDAYESRTF